MLIAIDIGNTNVHVGTARSGVLERAVCFPTDPGGTVESLRDRLATAADGRPDSVLASSVVRGMVDRVRDAASLLWEGVEVEEVTARTELGIESDVPKTRVGVDRLLAAAAAYRQVKRAVVVIGAGTALTVDGVSGEGRFVGGTISPGLRTKLRSLSDRTSLLPNVELARPEVFPGVDTAGSILAGVLYGTAGAADRLVEEFRNVLGAGAEVVVTGGDGPLLASYLKAPHRLEANLVLRGLVNLAGHP